MKTYSMKSGEVTHKWVLIDAAGVPVGRLASFVATRLSGKYQTSYTPHIDSGDYVVVINAKQAWLTGDKYKTKPYFNYSGYPSGIKQKTARQIGKVAAIKSAVKGMLAKNKLQPDRLKRLYIYEDANHQQAAQQPQPLKLSRKGDK
jgi:large subunit ribosomal protein L13